MVFMYIYLQFLLKIFNFVYSFKFNFFVNFEKKNLYTYFCIKIIIIDY